MSAKRKQSAAFSLEQKFVSELLANGTFVPDILLDFYQQLGLDAENLVFILGLLRHKKGREHLVLGELAVAFSCSKEKLAERLLLLEEKCLLAPLPQPDGFSLEPLFAQLFDFWAFSKMSAGRKAAAAPLPDEAAQSPKKTPFGQLHRSFEKEFGRCLSPIENEKLSLWLTEDKLPPDLIAEALRRAVLQGKASFAYIDKILQSWQKQNLSSLTEVLQSDNHPAAVRPQASKTKPQTKSEYSSFYEKAFKP